MQKGVFDRTGSSRLARLIWESAMRTLTHVQTLFLRLMVANSGAATAEYAFLIAFIAIVGALGMILLGDDMKVYFENLSTAIDGASDPSPDPFGT